MEFFSVISFRGETISGEDQRPDPGDGGNRAYHRRCREISAVFSGYKKCKSLFHLSLTHMVQIYIQFHISLKGSLLMTYIIGQSKGKKQLDLRFPDYILQTTTSIRLDTATNQRIGMCLSDS